MDLQAELKDICRKDDVESFAKLFEEGLISTSGVQIGALARAYDSLKIYAYMSKYGIYWDGSSNGPLNRLYQDFFNACGEGDLKTIELMINEGFDFHCYNPVFIHAALENNHLEIVRFLLKKGSQEVIEPAFLHTYIEQYFQVEPDFDLTEEYRERTRHAKDVIRFLLEHGYDLNYIRHTKSQYGNSVVSRETVLDIAYYWQRMGNDELGDLIDFLRESGAKTLDELEEGLLPWKPILGPRD